MRNLRRQTQVLYFSVKTFRTDGIDEVSVYSKPEKHKFTVSSSGSTPETYANGIVPDYDRYITSFDRDFKPIEGMQVWVDVVPELDYNGYLICDEDGIPTVMPDYTLKRQVDTKKGNVARYLIHKNGDAVPEYDDYVSNVPPVEPDPEPTEGNEDDENQD